jgi:thymidylate kinase
MDFQFLVKNLKLVINMGCKIELLGLCGAGKSSFLTALTSELESKTDLGLAQPLVTPISQMPVRLIRILWIGLFTETITFVRFVINKSNWWLVKKVAYRSAAISFRGDDNVILVDSGILQPFLSFEIEERLSSSIIPITGILEGCVLPDLAIVFIVPPRLAMQRYEQRGLSGKGKLIRKNSGRYFNRAEELRKNLVAYCEMKNVQIIEVDSSQQFSQKYLDSKLKEIQEFINKREGKHE